MAVVGLVEVQEHGEVMCACGRRQRADSIASQASMKGTVQQKKNGLLRCAINQW